MTTEQLLGVMQKKLMNTLKEQIVHLPLQAMYSYSF